MSAFDLVFTLFGLLLGMAIAEVLGGFSRVLKLKRKARPVRVGWLTPLLGLFVVLDLTSFWLIAWEARNQISADYPTLAGVLAIVGTYYLVATLIFPDEPEEWPDYDDWYDKQKRLVVAGLLSANIAAGVGQVVLEILRPTSAEELAKTSDLAVEIAAWGALGIIALLVSLLFIRHRPTSLLLLVMLVTLMLGMSITADIV